MDIDHGNGLIEKRYDNGEVHWYLNGMRHREDGPASTYASGHTEWYRHGKFHREDGPAVEFRDGTRNWYIDGLLHREDGPAFEIIKNGKTMYAEWHINGVQISEQEFNALKLQKELKINDIISKKPKI
jgi:hypothetical protein